ncbi:MAG: hypothetical protein J5858_14765, partial [Lentisphaeria bacterium]|nr:hypothetical protein [Lentisphaeria bacterium]
MIKFFRRIFRLFLLLPWLIFMAVVSLSIAYRRDRWSSIKGMTGQIRKWGKGLLWIFNIKMNVHPADAQYQGGLV